MKIHFLSTLWANLWNYIIQAPQGRSRWIRDPVQAKCAPLNENSFPDYSTSKFKKLQNINHLKSDLDDTSDPGSLRLA